jgi:hypothetical protein
MTNDEIGALAMTLAACSPLEKLTNMEARTVLELLNQRGFLRQPPEDHPIATPPVRADLTKERL